VASQNLEMERNITFITININSIITKSHMKHMCMNQLLSL